MTVTSRARDAALAAAVGIASLILYYFTVQPDFGGPEDTPKFQFIGHVLGIPHAPGYPLYVLLSHLFVQLPIGTIAYRANMFSAVMAAVGCAIAYVIARQLGARRWSAVCAALGLATGASFWRGAVFAEVYSLAAVMAGLTMTLLLAWGGHGGTRRLVSAFAAFAFGLGNHLTIVGVVPAFAIYVLTRGRRLWSVRMVAASTIVLALGLSQYGLIILRTRQGAPFVENGAESVRELIHIVTAERFAAQRFAFSASEVITEHLPAVLSLIASELGRVGTALFLVGLIAGWRSANQWLCVGAAAGMFAMVLNITGDLRGFITPVMVLLWPVAATGVDALANLAHAIPRAGYAARAILLLLAAAMPVANLRANYDQSDQSDNVADARFLRAVFRQLPEKAAFITEDYGADMTWRYFRVTGEAGPPRGIWHIDLDPAAVREAASNGRRVFARGFGATYLAAEGLHFERVPVEGPPLAEWLALLPRGSLLVAATAYGAFPADLAAIGHAAARPPGRPRSFEALAAVAGETGSAWRGADDGVSLRVDGQSMSSDRLPVPDGLVASADASGARVAFNGRVVARIDNGAVVAIIGPNGMLERTLELAPGPPQPVQYAEALYELKGDAACATLTTGAWTDVGPVLASGGWVTTVVELAGSVEIETVAPGATGVGERSVLLLGDGLMRTTVTPDPAGDLITTEIRRTEESRPVFRLALDRQLPAARARLRPGGPRSSLTLCAFGAMRPLFEGGEGTGILRADFESEPYFGAGWAGAHRTPSGSVRDGRDGATLFLPLEAGRSYGVTLDLTARDSFPLDVLVDGVASGTCDPHSERPCDIIIPAAARAGVTALKFMVRANNDAGRTFVFRGARISTR